MGTMKVKKPMKNLSIFNKWGHSSFLEIVDEVRMLHRVKSTAREC